MLTVLFFIILLINFSLTIILYLKHSNRYERKKIRHLKKEINNLIISFNQNAERNLNLLENRIKEVNILIQKLKAVKVKLPISKNDKKISFVQKAYITSNSSCNKKEELEKQYSSTLNNLNSNDKSKVESKFMNISNNYFTQKNNYDKNDKHNFSNNFEDSINQSKKSNDKNKFIKDKNFIKKDKTHQIARLIGEGKSFNEIASIMEISLSELKLLTLIVKRRITS